MRKVNAVILFFVILVSCKPATIKVPNSNNLNFYIVTDFGRNGYYQQKPIAEVMGNLTEEFSPKFILASGDGFHYNGVESVTDPIFQTNFENVYSHPNLQVFWYSILGNHEYMGNTQAVLDYAKISRRWEMPARYYTMSYEVNDSVKIRILMLDTAPFVEKYRKDTVKYPDIKTQNTDKQLKWVDSVLTAATEKWTIVVGHHPIFSVDNKHGNTDELIQKLNPMLLKHKVDIYFCGHIHNFQHLKPQNCDMDYVVNSSASLSRKSSASESTKFHSSDPGFIICSVSSDTLAAIFVNHKSETVYTLNRVK